MEHLLKSAAIRSDVEGSCEELSRNSCMEYLAMIDQPNQKAIGNLNSVADSADHNDQEEPIYEYTGPWWDDSCQRWLCAVSEANPQKQRKVKEETEETTSNDVSPTKERARARAKKKAKARGGHATIAVSNDTLHESAQLQKGKERARIGSRRNSGRSTVELLAARKFERQGQRPRPILWKERCVRHRTRRFVQPSTAGLCEHHAVAACFLDRE